MKVELCALDAQVIASNNPWTGRGKASLNNIKITKLDMDPTLNEVIVNLPPISTSVTASQISTMSRFIGRFTINQSIVVPLSIN